MPSLLLSAASGTSTPQFVNNDNDAQTTNAMRSIFMRGRIVACGQVIKQATIAEIRRRSIELHNFDSRVVDGRREPRYVDLTINAAHERLRVMGIQVRLGVMGALAIGM